MNFIFIFISISFITVQMKFVIAFLLLAVLLAPVALGGPTPQRRLGTPISVEFDANGKPIPQKKS
jgi:hypothetical protein